VRPIYSKKDEGVEGDKKGENGDRGMDLDED
jgi:hypothetical protein